jgi:hypothetical protein
MGILGGVREVFSNFSGVIIDAISRKFRAHTASHAAAPPPAYFPFALFHNFAVFFVKYIASH